MENVKIKAFTFIILPESSSRAKLFFNNDIATILVLFCVLIILPTFI